MGSKRVLALMSVATVMIMVLAAFAAVPSLASDQKDQRVLVVFEDEVDEKLVKDKGGKVLKRYLIMPAVVATMKADKAKDLAKSSKVKSVSIDYKVSITKRPPSPPGLDKDEDPEPVTELQWGVDRIDAEKAWSTSTGSGVKVAVLDTGIDTDHPEFTGIYKGGYDFVNGDYSPEDDNGHGTHCAGIIAAYKDYDLDAEDQSGVVGVAYGVEIYAVKVLDYDGAGWYSDIIAGIRWAITNGMDIVSMSLSGSVGTADLKAACDDAETSGVLVVAAAGNSGKNRATFDNVQYPARYDSVVAVGATASNDQRARFSATGPAVEFVGPGVDIKSTWLSAGYDTKSGTSMACPHVAGTAALVMALGTVTSGYDDDSDGEWDPGEVRSLLADTAEDLGPSGRDNEYGFGIVDAEAAV